MHVYYGTYLRLGISVHDGCCAVVRVEARKRSPKVRRDPSRRADRHRYYRQMLEYHRETQAIVSHWRL